MLIEPSTSGTYLFKRIFILSLLATCIIFFYKQLLELLA